MSSSSSLSSSMIYTVMSSHRNKDEVLLLLMLHVSYRVSPYHEFKRFNLSSLRIITISNKMIERNIQKTDNHITSRLIRTVFDQIVR
mmetsp:Transcript_49925/g.50758  ORF Transcript_49925/g.50758 Transcript_49925/m.50758 type:complete len:87 (-) Transcript_49925:937-1197(-)